MKHKLLRKNRFLGLLFFVVIMVAAIMAFAATRRVTLTTYYPAPYGKYNDLQSKTLTVSDKVGIGTTYPTIGGRLEVRGSLGNSTASAIATHVPNYGSGGIAAYLGGRRGISLVANYIEDITFGLVDTDGDWSSSFTEYMRINGANGNVGIGTGAVAPTAKLDVRYGGAGALSDGLVHFGNWGANTLTTLKLGDSGYTSTRYLLRAIADTDADAGGPYDVFAIRTDGNVGIGTVNPLVELHVRGIGPGLTGNADIATESRDGYRWTMSTEIGGKWILNRDIPGTLPSIVVQQDGYVGIGTTNPGSRLDVQGGCISGSICSDKSMKENIQPLPKNDSYLEKTLKLNGVSFEWKNQKDKRRYYGLIAQDVEKIIPEVVASSSSSNGQMGLSCTGIDAVIVEAIKELKAKNDGEIKTLKQENNLLKTKVVELESRLKTIEEKLKK